MGKQPREFTICEADREELGRWLRAGTTHQRHAQRARIVLMLADGAGASTVGRSVGVSEPTVYKWRNRFMSHGVSGLTDHPRPGQPRRLDGRQVAKILKLTVEKVPKESTHWSTRLMAKYAGVTQWQVRQVWSAADLKPHRLKTFKISNDPAFAEKVVDVVGLYMNPPDNAVVLSVDEKTQIQALDRTQPMLPLRPGQVERRTHDYKRHGTTSLYAAFNVASGEVIGRVTQRHRAKEFLDFLKQINRSTAADLDLHLIMDNSSTHKTKAVCAWIEAHPRFKVHFTPTSASWLNAVESWFGQLERRAIYRGAFSSVKQLRDEIRRYIEIHNKTIAKAFKWTKSADSIIASVNRARNRADNG